MAERGLGAFDELWRWSVTDVDGFWDAVWALFDVLGERGDGPVREGDLFGQLTVGQRALTGALGAEHDRFGAHVPAGPQGVAGVVERRAGEPADARHPRVAAGRDESAM